MTLAHQLHSVLLNAIGALVAQSQICERAVAAGDGRSLSEVARLRDMLRELEDSTRELIDTAIDPRGSDLSSALHDELHEFQRRHPGIAVESTIEGASVVRARWLTRLAADIVHEALMNAARHGKPSRVEVSATVADDGLLLRIRDNGQGFDASRIHLHAGNPPGRYGIRIMQESARSVQGRLEISSAPGRGTQVTLFIPKTDGRPVRGKAMSERPLLQIP